MRTEDGQFLICMRVFVVMYLMTELDELTSDLNTELIKERRVLSEEY